MKGWLNIGKINQCNLPTVIDRKKEHENEAQRLECGKHRGKAGEAEQ